MSQRELADFLGFDQSYICRVERGQRKIRDVEHLRHMAVRLGIPVEELAVAAGMLGSPAKDRSIDMSMSDEGGSDFCEQSVSASQRQWRLVRQGLNRRRVELSRVAASVHADVQKLGTTPLLVRPDWLLEQPLDLADIALVWNDEEASAAVTGAEKETEAVRPMSATGVRYDRYSRAIRDIDRPTLLENRLSYRLLDVAWESQCGRLTFGRTTYFDMIDVCEAVAHELAGAWLQQAPTTAKRVTPEWDDLPFRRLIGDPFDLARRPLLPSIITLTLRQSDDSAAFILHSRDSAHVAIAGGMFQVMPAGVFQPSSISPLDEAHDFDLWHNVLREFSEEFLGTPEHDGSASSPIDYEGTEPFRTLNEARRQESLRIMCFGIGLDPLTLAGEILTVAVIDDHVFDNVFKEFVVTNMEGTAVAAGRDHRAADGIPFTEANVRRLLDSEAIAPSGAACLELAWRHRRTLLRSQRLRRAFIGE
jgi:transcriptional regulator with XRE-family HTH domain